MHKSRTSKIITSLTLSLMLGVSLFAGCNIVSRNMDRYYNAVVASYTYENGEKVTINKRELITSFNSFGYQYVQSYGMSEKDAYKETIKRIVDKKLTIREEENACKQENGGQILLAKEKTYLWEQTYDAIKTNIEQYYNDLNHITNPDSEDSSDGAVSQTIFTPNAILVPQTITNPYGDSEVVYTIQVENKIENEVEKYIPWNGSDRDIETENDLNALYNQMTKFVEDNSQYTSALNKYFSDAKKSEEGLKLASDKEAVFKREIKRIYTSIYESFMVTKYSQAHQYSNSSVTLSNLQDLYQSKVVNDYNKYMVEQASGYDDAVLSNVASVNYIKPDSVGTQYFYVSHILAKFSDEDQAKYNEYMKVVNGESKRYTVGQAKQLIEQLYTNLTFPVREKVENEDGTVEWKETGKTKPVSAVMAELKASLETAGDNQYKKAEIFNDFIYKYNQDDGMFNAERNYVIGIDYHTPDEENNLPYTIRSNMVEPFTNAAIKLYDDNKAKIGDIYSDVEDDGLIRTEYGIHIMMYEGRVKNLFEGIGSSFELRGQEIGRLASNEARLKAGESKTIFDSLFDEINKDNSSVFENMNLEFLRSKIKLTFYPDEYKDLYE